MGRKAADLTGQRFGKLVVIARADPPSSKFRDVMWHCICDCGAETDASASSLRRGVKKSCGCLKRTLTHASGITLPVNYCREKLYHVWDNMIKRCEDPHHVSYKHYGARGITVCEEWHDYAKFREWAISSGYIPGVGLSIDRKDVNGNYEPANCRWSTSHVQANNKSNSALFEYHGETKTIANWARQYGIKPGTLWYRLSVAGWDFERAITEPVGAAGRHDKYFVEYHGETKALADWAREYGLGYLIVYYRYVTLGWDIEKCLTTPEFSIFDKEPAGINASA